MKTIINAFLSISLLALVAACGNSNKREIRATLRAEIAKSQRENLKIRAFVKGCALTIPTIIPPEAKNDPLLNLRIVMYCNSLGQNAVKDIPNEHRGVVLGCIRTILANKSAPENSQQENALVTTCDEIVTQAEKME